MLAVLGPEGFIEFANQRTVDFVGLSLAELRRCAWDQLIHPDDVASTRNTLRRSSDRVSLQIINCRLRHVSGGRRWVEMHLEPRVREHKLVHWYALLIDIEHRREAEDARKASEHELHLLVDTVPALIWRATPDGFPDYLNQHLCDYLGKSIRDFDRSMQLHPDDVDEVLRTWDEARALERMYESTHRLLGGDGRYRWVTCYGLPLRDAQGRIRCWYGVIASIERVKRMESVLNTMQTRLSRASELAAVAQLSASIAHEINQPLAALVANGAACLEWLMVDPPNVERARLTAERVVRDGYAAANVIQRVRELFSQVPTTRVTLDLNAVVREVHELISTELLDRKVHWALDLAAQLPLVQADRVHMQQVLVNLIRNALEAMEATTCPNQLTVRTRHQTKVEAHPSVSVEVCDSGHGLRPGEMVFDPFFTTKRRGMGMGLTICRTIVEAHGGTIWARSNTDQGATFGFSLPVCEADLSLTSN